MKAEKLSQIVGGILVGNPSALIRGFSIDSRKVREGDVFFALKGQNHDGHDFILDAYGRGAVGAVSERHVDPPEDRFLIKVGSTIEALRRLGRFMRDNFRGKVIGIAGSVGKTTTKEMISHLLSSVARTFRSEGNLNSQIGLPLVLSNMDLEADYAVLELGASRRGEVLKLTELSRPSVRVITAVGEEHLETFGTIEDVIEGNGEIFHLFSEEDYAVIPHRLRDRYGLPGERVITFGGGRLLHEGEVLSVEGVEFDLWGERFRVPVLSKGIVENALASFGVLISLGYDPRDFRERLATFRPPEGRMNVLRFDDFYLIDDTYNANPPSVRNALETLSSLKTGSKKVVVLGDMLELGERSGELHAEIGALMRESGVDFAVFYGRETYYSYREFVRRGGEAVFSKERGEVLEEVLKWLKDKNIILLKGSRGMRMETFIDDIRGAVGL